MSLEKPVREVKRYSVKDVRINFDPLGLSLPDLASMININIDSKSFLHEMVSFLLQSSAGEDRLVGIARSDWVDVRARIMVLLRLLELKPDLARLVLKHMTLDESISLIDGLVHFTVKELKTLIENGLRIREFHCETILKTFITRDSDIELFKFLFQFFKTTKDVVALIRTAGKSNRLDIVEFLLEETEVDVNHVLINVPIPGVIRLLIEKGADPNYDGSKPLEAAIISGTFESVQELVELGADASRVDFFCVKLAIASRRPDVVDFLLTKFDCSRITSALADFTNNISNFEELVEMVRVVLKHGADPAKFNPLVLLKVYPELELLIKDYVKEKLSPNKYQKIRDL